jgi:hypothetical protein
MKTKLLALMILAGGSMFAQTRFSIGIGVGGHGTGYYQPAPPSYRADASPRPGPDSRYNNAFVQQGFTRGLDQDRDRDFDRDRNWDRDRDWDRRTDRDGGPDDDHGRRSNGFSNEFRGR